MIKKLYDKCIIWAGHKYANSLLGFVAFIESSFFPIPPDAMIVPMVIAKRNNFLKIVFITTIFSVLGGLLGYLIGYIFFNEIGYKIFEFYGYENVNLLKEKFSTKGGLISWFGIVFLAGFTPLPYKIFTITSGFIHFNILFFIFASVVARGLRFFLVGYLVYKYGSKIGPFLEKKGGQWTVIISGIIFVVIAGIYFIFFK
tara:strand:- start:6376 stop:6975 length:600 start_codon:yes stop_codon:yes gene_type:complete